MNEYDSNRIVDLTKKINYMLTKNSEEANCYILNTCHIREKSTDKVYHDIGRVKKIFRNKKKPIVLVVGCVAQAEGDLLLKKEKYIDAVIGPQSYHKINQTILDIENKKKNIELTEFDVIEKFDNLSHIKNSNNNTSVFLTIQEGCDKFCKFCVVPYTRGPEYSRPFSQIISEAKQLIDNGAKEIILLGQNVNAYRYENKRLSDLIEKLNSIGEFKRIRYTTSHPRDFTEDLIQAHGSVEKLMPLLHLPVQSGSSKILKSMNRLHTIEEYLKTIEKLKEKNPSMKFSSDFIIGYPGETVEDFNKSLLLLTKVKFIHSFSFIFSARPGTPAAKLNNVDVKIAKNRLIKFQSASDEIKEDYKKRLLNKNLKVLFENRINHENQFFGRDEFFNSVIVQSKENLVGKIKKVKISQYNMNTLKGELAEKFDNNKKKKDVAA